MNLSKLEVARRQLVTAIYLYLSELDPISIHTLLGASSQILSDLINKKDKYFPHLKNNDLIKDEYKKEFISKLNASRNFFKHADKDTSETHTFKTEFNDYELINSIGMYLYIKKNDKILPIIIATTYWLQNKYPKLYKNNYITTFYETFGSGKIMTKQALLQSIMPEILNTINQNQ